MFKFIKRIMGLSGEYRKKLNRAYVLSFFESLATAGLFLFAFFQCSYEKAKNAEELFLRRVRI